MQEFLEEVVPEKTFIITAKGASTYIGESVDFNDLRLFYLKNSKGGSNISDDELFEKIKPTVLHTAHEATRKMKK